MDFRVACELTSSSNYCITPRSFPPPPRLNTLASYSLPARFQARQLLRPRHARGHIARRLDLLHALLVSAWLVLPIDVKGGSGHASLWPCSENGRAGWRHETGWAPPTRLAVRSTRAGGGPTCCCSSQQEGGPTCCCGMLKRPHITLHVAPQALDGRTLGGIALRSLLPRARKS